jgi:DNA-binding NarL/FixJ family response regulator
MSITVVVAGAGCSCARVAAQALSAEPDIEVLACPSTREAAGALLRAYEPDVAVVDAGLLALKEFFLTGWGPVSRATRIVVVGRDEEAAMGQRLLAQGAAAYVPESEIPTRLARAVAEAAGRAAHTASAAGSIAAATLGESPSPIA